MTPRIPDKVQHILDEVTASGLTYVLEDGGKHFKIKVAGRLAAILPKGQSLKSEANHRTILNMRAQVRRVIKETNHG